MHMQQIQLLGFENFQHLCSEREGVGRVVEKRVGRYLHLMKKDMRIVQIHANRRRIADEMNVVAAGSQFLAQFSGDDAGTAVRGVAGDADAHSLKVFSIRRREANTPTLPVAARMTAVSGATVHRRGCLLDAKPSKG